MSRPALKRDFKRPSALNEYPQGTVYPAGHLVEGCAAWRHIRPAIDQTACSRCKRCWLVCPEGAMRHTDGRFDMDFDFCKGCGVCARECPRKAIRMTKEAP
ncbi:MAG: 4Fe-4S binding protein [Kiritimatiellia bacterium]